VLGRNWSGVLELYEQHELVTEGPYRFVRHPMYTSVYLKGIGILLLSANWIVGGGYLAAVTLMYALRVRDEEQMMLEHFGEEYRSYMSRTARLVPLPGAWMSR
jgi:protein-S-isoprenylcysteine O-methyltransferase Ste14